MPRQRHAAKYWWWILGTLCLLSLVMDPLVHKHPYFGFDGSWAFYGGFGFAAALLMLLGADQWGALIDRKAGTPKDVSE